LSKNFSKTYEVCTCKHVSLAEIIFAIKNKNAKNLAQIERFTDAGSVCTCCKSKNNDFSKVKKLYIDEILDKILSKE